MINFKNLRRETQERTYCGGSPMTKQRPLINIIKGLVRKARLPRFFNRKGPRWHPTWQVLLCYAVYCLHTTSWRRAARFMREFYGQDLHWTCWQKAIAKWPLWVWYALQRASAGDEACEIAAIDGTSYSRSNPSQHFFTRILGGRTSRPVQEIALVDVKRRKFLSWRVRANPRGETRRPIPDSQQPRHA